MALVVNGKKAASVKRLDAVLGKVNLPSWCFIVVPWWSRAQGHLLSHIFQVWPVEIQFIFNRSSELFFFLFPWGSQMLGGTIATMLSQAPRRDSKDFCCFFPRGCTFSMAKTIACCPCHFVRVTLTSAIGKEVKFARWWPLKLSHCMSATFSFLVRFKRWLLSFYFLS